MGCYISRRRRQKRLLAATLTLQRRFRLIKLRREVKSEALLEVYKKLLKANEFELTAIRSFFNELVRRFGIVDRPLPRKSLLKERSSSVSRASLHMQVESDIFQNEYSVYKMKRISFPLNSRDFTKIIECLLNPKHNILPPSCVYNVLKHASKELQRLPNVNLINVQKNGLMVVGSIHGNLKDLMLILFKCGLPGPHNIYLFNGNLVDVGHQSIEVLVVILAAFLTFPKYVYINRGKHEDYLMNARFGFFDEILQKYTDFYAKLVYWIDEVWRWLPFATVVNDKIFISNGGFTPDTSIEYLEPIRREKYISLLRPTVYGLDLEEWNIMIDFICGQVHDENDHMFSEGYDAKSVTDFLNCNGLTHMIVSSDITVQGYESLPNAQLTILSSASNIFSPFSNKAAVLMINEKLKFQFIRIDSYELINEDLCKMSQRVRRLQKHVLHTIKSHLNVKISALTTLFLKFDEQGSNCVRFEDWCTIMAQILNTSLNWSFLIHLFPEYRYSLKEYPRKETKINYNLLMLSMANDTFENLETLSKNAAETLFRTPRTIDCIFWCCCQPPETNITLKDFEIVCDLLEKYIPSIEPIEDLRDIANELCSNDPDCLLSIDDVQGIFSTFNNKKAKLPSVISSHHVLTDLDGT